MSASPAERLESPDYRSTFLGPNTLELLGLESPDSITITNDWAPYGETYATAFCVGSDQLIAKACVKFSPREVVGEWLDRRRIISDLGLETPTLRVVDGATIIEEYIPHTLGEAYTLTDGPGKENLKASFLDAYWKIVATGFRPISFHDIRSRGQDVVFVDFGSDLGGILAAASEEAANNSRIDAARELERLIR